MTKAVRIENADTSNHKLEVEIWNKPHDGGPDVLERTVALDHPASMTTEHVHTHRYFIVKESAPTAT